MGIFSTVGMLAQCAAASDRQDCLSFLKDKGFTRVSFYGDSAHMLSAFYMLAYEELFSVYRMISEKGAWYYNTASISCKSQLIESITDYDSDVPIICEDSVTKEIIGKLKKLTDNIYIGFRVLKYASIKSSLIKPMQTYFPNTPFLLTSRANLWAVKNRSEYEKMLLDKNVDKEKLYVLQKELCYHNDENYT
ncbi:hypothetical protein FACS1894132_11980 [Clostridia bacterium]|nr:hypothetical protein FACS1894132_11980 [Clostridia bacterium]